MKHCVRIVLVACLVITACRVSAQTTSSYGKTIFSQLPNQISCSATELDKLFLSEQGKNTTLSLGGNLHLEGIVKQRIRKYDQLETIGISLPAYDDIILGVTRRYDNNHQPVFAAQMISTRYADGYLLSRLKDGSYQFTKINREELMPVCAH